MTIIGMEPGTKWRHADGDTYMLLSTDGAYKQDDGNWINGLVIYRRWTITGRNRDDSLVFGQTGPFCMTKIERWAERFTLV